MDKLVSIIIPTYNRKKTIKKAIESCLNQTYENIEVIVVDDGSSDGTESVLKKIKDTRFKYFVLKQNKGACYARNYGIKKAKGEYISFNDSDDFYRPDKIEKQMNNLNKSKSDMDYCKIRIHDDDFFIDRPTKEEENSIKEIGILKQILKENCVSNQSILVKRDILLDTLYDETLPRFQDYDLLIRLMPRCKISYSPYVLADCYRSIDSISRNMEKLEKAIKIMLSKEYDIDKEDKANLNNFLITIYANHSIEEKNKERNNFNEIIDDLNNQIDEKNEIINAIDSENKRIKREYDKIVNSKTWKVRNKIVKIFKRR